MTMARIIAIAIGAFVLWLLSQMFFIVDQRQTALVMRFGEVNRFVANAGLHFKWPIADEVVDIENRIFMWSSDNMAVQVSDKQRYLVDTITLARVTDAQKFRETVSADLSLAEQRIKTRLDAALRQTYGKRTFEAALSKDRDVMMAEIRDQLRDEAQSLGIQIVDVRIRRTDLMKEVLDATYDRMKSERLAEAQDLRGKGEASKTRLMAEADRKVLEIISEGKRQSEIIRGEGEAERASIFAAAFNKDPEFYAFYRSMQAYDKSLGQGGTNLVLSPNSEFFRYFGAQKDTSQVPTAKQ
ncbi:MAG: protease modulator HflC [Alphaproteobacteria bacterium]|nr:protease modulator HflC [Alphaproteobacteria bacterium]